MTKTVSILFSEHVFFEKLRTPDTKPKNIFYEKSL